MADFDVGAPIDGGSFTPAPVPQTQPIYQDPEFQQPAYQQYEEVYDPLQDERRRSRRTTIIIVVVIVVIILFLVGLFLYANLKKNKSTFDPFQGPVAIQNEDGEHWGLGTFYFHSTDTQYSSIQKLNVNALTNTGMTSEGFNYGSIVYVDYRRRDPNTRWFIRPSGSSFQIFSAFETSYGSLPLRVSERSYGTQWPPTRNPSADGVPLANDDYGAFAFIFAVVELLLPPTNSNFNFIPAGSRNRLGYPFEIMLAGSSPALYLTDIPPFGQLPGNPWPIGTDLDLQDGDTSKVNYMNQRKRLYVSTTPRVWYIR